MSENTQNHNDESIEAARKKFVEQMTDLSNPDTRNLIRALFADFCNSKKAEEVRPNPASEELNDDIQKAVKDVLRKHNISRAECSIGIKYNTSEPKPAPEPEAASTSEPMTTQEPETETAPEAARVKSETELLSQRKILDDIIAKANAFICDTACYSLPCKKCPLNLRIGNDGMQLCIRNEIRSAINHINKQGADHA